MMFQFELKEQTTAQILELFNFPLQQDISIK